MDNIGAFYTRLSRPKAIVIVCSGPFYNFFLYNTDVLLVINWLSRVYLFLYFDRGFFAVYYGGWIENLSYSGCRKFNVI